MNHLFKSEILLILGNNIYKIRQQKNLTITALAKLARYGRGYLSKLEVGKQNVTLNTIIKISKALDVNLTTLFFRENNTYYRNYIEDNYIEVFSENVKKNLLKKRRSLCSLSIDIEIDLATLSRILNGKQNNPWIISLEKIAKGINKNIGDLLIRY